ncbi:hypothetical protein FKM82_008064 [Ascaphus truei]
MKQKCTRLHHERCRTFFKIGGKRLHTRKHGCVTKHKRIWMHSLSVDLDSGLVNDSGLFPLLLPSVVPITALSAVGVSRP